MSIPHSEFAPRVIVWQRQHGRHGLPWQVSDPYKIWLSEIMLQQTQVGAVLGYYSAFLQRFPDVTTLAAAPVDAVLAAWSGLGYYSRARNLHRAAQLVVAQYGGQFPASQAGLISLPGIGRSTAAAIAAFAFGQRAAILDGNVKRVLTRCYGVEGWPGDKKVENQLWTLAEQVLPGDANSMTAYTQGLMDLGSQVCVRGQPQCPRCPLNSGCVALASGRTRSLPTARPRKVQPQRSTLMLLARSQDGQVWLERRPPSGIWGGLWSLPQLDSPEALPAWLAQAGWSTARLAPAWPAVQHVFTHFRLTLTPQPLMLEQAEPGPDNGQWWPLEQALALGLPAPIRRLLAECGQGRIGDMQKNLDIDA